jgi:hypothetical protein
MSSRTAGYFLVFLWYVLCTAAVFLMFPWLSPVIRELSVLSYEVATFFSCKAGVLSLMFYEANGVYGFSQLSVAYEPDYY